MGRTFHSADGVGSMNYDFFFFCEPVAELVFVTLCLCWSFVGYLMLRGAAMTTSSPDVSVSTPESRPADSLES